MFNITPSASARLSYIRFDENNLNIGGNSIKSDTRINNKIVNLSSNTTKMSFRVSFVTFKASLAFIQLKKTFTKTLILHHIDLDNYIQIETNVSSNVIDRILSQLTFKKDLADQAINKSNNPSNLVKALSEID